MSHKNCSGCHSCKQPYPGFLWTVLPIISLQWVAQAPRMPISVAVGFLTTNAKATLETIAPWCASCVLVSTSSANISQSSKFQHQEYEAPYPQRDLDMHFYFRCCVWLQEWDEWTFGNRLNGQGAHGLRVSSVDTVSTMNSTMTCPVR